ncbi:MULTISPECIES: PTS mannose/fructose/sorbose/N-acetylgalactosamine transporter subunit IIC [Halobacillus]|uniref:PTS mannose/fructose/sorbose/N-acetylgalactosamine transporter subunit IIC n=1 Tax=Halobacillus TaxID=45667 RepID=UPI000408FD6E|nr:MULTISPECIES: PTS sugar transporter subunit IIC [Halobacillus]MCA1020537.1 PTS sugar transporter subunit IIC [Halobacillus litoralis]
MDIILMIQALAIGIFCYLGSVSSPWLLGVTGGYYTIGRPLVAGLIIGIILGDVTTGIILGVAVQAAFIATISTGGTQNQEITYAAYGGIALGILAEASTGVTVTLSVGIGVLGLFLHNLMMVLNSGWNRRAENAAKKGDAQGIARNNGIYPQIVNFLLRVIPIGLAVYLGEGFVKAFLDFVPDKVTHMMDVLGGLLPALGIALLMNLLIREKSHFIFFVTGFAFIVFISNNMIALTIFSLLIAYVIYLVASNSTPSPISDDDEVI